MAKHRFTTSDLRYARTMILKNVREHCSQLYRRGSMTREACRVAAAIAAAEITDVFKEAFGVKI